MLHLPSVQVAPPAPHWLSPQLKRKLFAHFGSKTLKTVCTFKNPQTKQLDVSKLHITCIFQHTFWLLASFAEQKNPECDSYLEVQTAGRRNALAFWRVQAFLGLQPEWEPQFLHVGSSKYQSINCCSLSAGSVVNSSTNLARLRHPSCQISVFLTCLLTDRLRKSCSSTFIQQNSLYPLAQ